MYAVLAISVPAPGIVLAAHPRCQECGLSRRSVTVNIVMSRRMPTSARAVTAGSRHRRGFGTGVVGDEKTGS
jgi:hypothetical protein